MKYSLDQVHSTFNHKFNLFGLKNGTDTIKDLPSIWIDNSMKEEVYSWCQENMGDDWIWNWPQDLNQTKIIFRNRSDAMMFKIRFATA